MRPRRIIHGLLSAGCVLTLIGSLGCYSLRSRLDPCGRLLPVPDPPGGEVLPMNFSPEGEGFRIGLPPTKPVEGERAGGTRGKTYRWFVFNEGQYEVTYVESDDLPTEPDAVAAMLDRLKESSLSHDKRQLESEKELRLGPHAGRELVLRNEDGVLIRRFYLAGGRLYALSAAVSSKLERCALGGIVKHLDSFEILEEGAPAATPAGPQ